MPVWDSRLAKAVGAAAAMEFADLVRSNEMTVSAELDIPDARVRMILPALPEVAAGVYWLVLLKVAALVPAMVRAEAVVVVLSMSRLPMVIFWPVTRAAEGLRVTVTVVAVPAPAAASEAVNVVHVALVPSTSVLEACVQNNL